jgi:hypothetical protein
MTFAPPSGSPSEPAAWSSPELPATPGAQRRRGGALAVVAILALVALGVGALVAIGSSDSDGVTLPAVEPFSLAAAAQNTIDARSVVFDLTVSVGDVGDVTVSGAVDNETRLMSVSTDLSALLSLDSAMPIGDGAVELLFDAATGVIYISADALGGLLPGDAAWVSADLGVLAEKAGTTVEEMQGELFVDPTESARLLLDADNVVEIGNETIDGVDTVHYEVTVDVAAAIAASPQAGSKLGEAGVDVPDTVAYDVWVTSDNQLRRASFDMNVADQNIADQTVAMVLNMRPSEQSLGAQVPTDSFDITGLLDW